MEHKLTKEEEFALKSLRDLNKKWPSTLWVFSANNTFCVMKKDKNNNRAVLKNHGMDPDYVVDTMDKIECDGGDW